MALARRPEANENWPSARLTSPPAIVANIAFVPTTLLNPPPMNAFLAFSSMRFPPPALNRDLCVFSLVVFPIER